MTTTRRTTPPTILSHLGDAANLLTLAGLACSVAAITLAVRGEYPGAAITLVGAFLFDLVDGPVAKRTAGRTPDQGAFGANLDSLADMVAAGVAMGVLICAYGHFEVAPVAVAVLLAAATAMRLSYFNVHGIASDAGSYTGLPTDLAVMGFVTVLLLDVPMDAAAFRVTICVAGVVLAGLMVSPVRIPKQTGAWFVANVVAAFVLAGLHALRLFG
ncbi:MAG: CDP-alcohol phosphatidyltransferase family protein [Jatrophihabitans sp.]